MSYQFKLAFGCLFPPRRPRKQTQENDMSEHEFGLPFLMNPSKHVLNLHVIREPFQVGCLAEGADNNS